MADNSNLPSKPADKKLSVAPQDSELVRELIQQRRQELAIEQRRLEVEAKSDERAHEYAMAALDARKEENGRLQSIYGSSLRIRNITIAIATLGFVGLIFYCIRTGNQALVQEMIKAVVMVGGGLGAGYVFGYRKGRHEGSQADEDDD